MSDERRLLQFNVFQSIHLNFLMFIIYCAFSGQLLQILIFHFCIILLIHFLFLKIYCLCMNTCTHAHTHKTLEYMTWSSVTLNCMPCFDKEKVKVYWQIKRHSSEDKDIEIQVRKCNNAPHDCYKTSSPPLLWLLNQFRKHLPTAVYLPHRFILWTQLLAWLHWK
jgi:hypothetical protein